MPVVTVIAYRDGVMAADSLLTSNGMYQGEAVKVRDINGCLVGISGTWGVACELFSWFEDECADRIKRPPATIHVDDDKYPVNMLIVNKRNGAVFYIDGLGFPQSVTSKFFAIGSGANVAMGAMEMGADAVKAVKVACKYDSYCGGRIRVVKLDNKKGA